jgi:hypothetical protein
MSDKSIAEHIQAHKDEEAMKSPAKRITHLSAYGICAAPANQAPIPAVPVVSPATVAATAPLAPAVPRGLFRDRTVRNSVMPPCPLEIEQRDFVEMRVAIRQSLNAITDSSWRTFAGGKSPKDPAIAREWTVKLGQWKQRCILARLSGQAVYLIMDGVTINGKQFYPILLRDAHEMFLFACPRLKKTDHLSIVQAIQPVVDAVSSVNGDVQAIIADGARNIRRAVDQDAVSETIQTATGRPILDIPCAVHGVHLILDDFEKGYQEFRAFKQKTMQLLEFLRKHEVRDFMMAIGAHGEIPSIQDIKWCTYPKATSYIQRNIGHIAQALAQPRLNRRSLTIPEHFREFALTFEAIGRLIVGIEGDLVKFPDFFVKYMAFLAELEQASSDIRTQATISLVEGDAHGQPVAAIFDPPAIVLELAKARENKSFSLEIAKLAHAFTYDGQPEWQNHFDLSRLEVPGLPTEEIVQEARAVVAERDGMAKKMARMVRYMNNGDDNLEASVEIWVLGYLAGRNGRPNKDYLGYWQQALFNEDALVRQVARVVRILMTAPVSEASAERLASLLEALFEGKRWSSGADLVEAEVVVRASQCFKNVF